MDTSEKLDLYTDVIKTASESLNYGMIYVGTDGRIKEYSPMAMEMMGLTVPKGNSHPGGRLESGDIVVFLDNDLGNDDKMTPDDLKVLNISSKDIRQGSVVLAMGVYNNKKIQPVYKVFNEYIPDSKIELVNRYLGFSIEASIDFDKRRMSVIVNGKEYYMDYLESIGYMLAIDGSTGIVKFFQAKGYSFRGEDVGLLLRGGNFLGKNVPGQVQELIHAIGLEAGSILIGEEILNALKALMESEDGEHLEGVYEIYRRMVYCHMIRIRKDSPYDGVYIFVQDNEVTENATRQTNPLTVEVEKRAKRKSHMSNENEASALDVITGYDWPGNVRELENIIERAITVCDGRIVYSENLMIRQGTRLNATLKERIEDSERKIIEDTLFKNNDDRKKTMEELGLSRTVFYEKLKKYGITG